MINLKKILSVLLRMQMTSDQYINRLRRKGIRIGDGCRIFDPVSTLIDTQNPHMIQIGDNVRLTRGVIILSHDYSWSVLAGIYDCILGGVGGVKIGDNVFVGMNTIILKNTEIGDNVIIGAGCIVSGKIDSNSVYAGVPARKIMDLKTFYEKRKANQDVEMQMITEQYNKMYHNMPPESILREYFWNFADRSKKLNHEYEGLLRRTGFYEKLLKSFYNPL